MGILVSRRRAHEAIIRAQQGSLLINSNIGFESGSYLDVWQESGNNLGETFTMETTTVREGTYALKVDCSALRAEIMPRSDNEIFNWYTNYWWGCSFYTDDADLMASNEYYMTYFQMHAHPYNDDWTYGAGESGWTIGIKNNYLYNPTPNFHFSIENTTEANATTFVPSTGAYSDRQTYYTPATNIVDQWNDIVLNWLWSPYDADNPFFKMWFNGVQVVDETGPNIYLLDKGGRVREPYCNIQMGVYKTNNGSSRTVYLDEVKFALASSGAGYNDVKPGSSGTPSNPPTFSIAEVGNVNSTTLVVTFTEPLASGNTDGSYSVDTTGAAVTLSSPTIDVDGNLRLTISRAIVGTETLDNFSYTNSGTNPLQNSNGDEVITFTGGDNITNNTGSSTPATTDSWADTNRTGSLNMSVAANSYLGQVFQASHSDPLTSFKFNVRAIGDISARDIQLKLTAITGTPGTNATPTGSVLATSEVLLGADIGGTYYMEEWVFPSPYTLTNTTWYAVYIEYTGTAFDSTNYLAVGVDAGGTHGGNSFRSSDGSTWNSLTSDLPFEAIVTT